MLYKLFLAILSFIIHDSAGYVNSIQTIFENFAFKSADAIVSRPQTPIIYWGLKISITY